MPTYVYEILTEQGKGTGETFEVVQSMKEDAWERVPSKEGLDVTMFGKVIGNRLEVSIPWGHRCRRVPQAFLGIRVREARARSRMPKDAPRKLDPRESLTHFFPNPDKARRQMPGAAHLIRDDGTVRYSKPSDELAMKRAFEGHERRRLDKSVERHEKGVEIKKKTGVDPFSSSGRVKKEKIPEKLRKKHRIT